MTEKTLREKAIGTWKLDSFYVEEDGKRVYLLGEDATGFIIYTADGYMSAQLMAQGRPAYESNDMLKGTQDEMAQAAEGYMAYSGRFEVDEETSTFTHYMDVSMNPTWLGQNQPRIIEIEGDTLSIINGLQPNNRIIWKRAEVNS